jgi:AraC-like DNA-binding protein
MLFRQHVPPPPLSEFVDSFWVYENSAHAHTMERILPSGSLSAIINLHEDSVRAYDRDNPSHFESLCGSLFVGAHSEYMVIDTACQAAVLGIQFKPGGAFPFLNMPANELQDLHVPLETLWKADGASLRARLLDAPTPEEKFRVLERCLLAQVKSSLGPNPMVGFALREFRRNRTVSEVISQIGLTPKRFIDIFRREVGLTPKLYSRIHRFQEVLRNIRAGKQVSWADTAVSCGYFDQAHFVHDFRAFSGITPTEYVTLQGPHANHVPLTR